MNTAKLITKGYFIGALGISFTHIITSAHKMGGDSYEPFIAPFMIDGIALLGMHMRNEKYDDRTNKIGLLAQSVAGLASLAMNVYAAHSLFGMLIGIGVVVLFLATEWMSANIRLRADVQAEQAATEAQQIVEAANAWMSNCSHPTKCSTADQCSKKSEAAAKRSKTVARKNRQRKAQERVLAEMTK